MSPTEVANGQVGNLLKKTLPPGAHAHTVDNSKDRSASGHRLHGELEGRRTAAQPRIGADKYILITSAWTRTPENQAVDQLIDRLRITGIDDAAGGMEAAARQANPAVARVMIESETPGAIDATAALADALMSAEHVDIIKFWRQRVGEDGYKKLLADPATAAIALWRAIDNENEELIDQLRADFVRAKPAHDILFTDDNPLADVIIKQRKMSYAHLRRIVMNEQVTLKPRPAGEDPVGRKNIGRCAVI